MLMLRIMAIPDFDINSTNFNNLVALMSMQWDSLITEEAAHPGHLAPSTMSSQTVFPPSSSASPQTPANSRVPLRADAEKEHLTMAGGCWRYWKVPKDTSWIPHVGCTCPGDAAQGILLGCDYISLNVSIKKEFAGAVLAALPDDLEEALDTSGKDQPDTYGYYCDDDTD